MIRTISELHRSARRLFELGKRAPIHRRERLLKLARLGLKLAEVQLRDPKHRPDVRLRLGADQYRAIAEFLLANPETEKRGRNFAGLAESAEWMEWPSSAYGPFLALNEEEVIAIWNGPPSLRQRVFAPYLTATEQAALRQDGKQMLALARKAFAEKPKQE